MAQTGVPLARLILPVIGWAWNLVLGSPRLSIPSAWFRVLNVRAVRSCVLDYGGGQERFGSADSFFETFMVVNYCPLVFMEASGKNRTPDKLPAAEIQPVNEACDWALLEMAKYYKPERVIGVGAYAEKKAATVLSELNISIGRILHPSPASPIANRGWAPAAEKQLSQMGIDLP